MKKYLVGLGFVVLFGMAQVAAAQTIGRVLGARARGVVLEAGENAGVQKGDLFWVFRDSLAKGKLLRTKIGRVEIVKTFPKISVARIVWVKPETHIRKGDVAIHTEASLFTDYFSSGNLQLTFSAGMNKLYLTDLNRALVQQGSVYGVNAKGARINTGSAFGVRFRARLPFHLGVLWEGNYLSTATRLEKDNSAGKNVVLSWAAKAWSANLGLTFSPVDTRLFELYTGARVGALISDVKFLNTLGSTFDNGYFEDTNVASGVFAGISYKPNNHVVLTLEAGYDSRGLGHLTGYRYTPGKKWDNYIPRAAITGKRINVDLSGISVMVGLGARL